MELTWQIYFFIWITTQINGIQLVISKGLDSIFVITLNKLFLVSDVQIKYQISIPFDIQRSLLHSKKQSITMWVSSWKLIEISPHAIYKLAIIRPKY